LNEKGFVFEKGQVPWKPVLVGALSLTVQLQGV